MSAFDGRKPRYVGYSDVDNVCACGAPLWPAPEGAGGVWRCEGTWHRTGVGNETATGPRHLWRRVDGDWVEVEAEVSA